jgi:hypothetical protein
LKSCEGLNFPAPLPDAAPARLRSQTRASAGGRVGATAAVYSAAILGARAAPLRAV